MPWQRHVAHVAFEHDDDGLLVYRYLVLVVPRQAGKTALCESILVWGSMRGPDRTAIYTAQTREMARRRIIEELETKRLARSNFAGHYKVRRSIGSEQIRFANNSQIALVAGTSDAGHGLTIDQAVLDETWTQPDFALIDALDPAMITRPDPMFVMPSTVGDGGDTVLIHFQDLGRAGVEKGSTDEPIAFFEWSAGDDDSIDDPVVWRRTHPALGHTITEARLVDRLKVLEAPNFARAYLCRRPSVRDAVVFSGELWTSRGDNPGPAHDAQVVIAVDVALDRSCASIGVCATSPRGGHVVVVDRRPGVDWLPDSVRQLADHRRVLAGVMDGRSAAAALQGSLQDASPGLEWKLLSTSDVVAAAGQFYDAVRAEPPMLWHCNQPELNRAVINARKRIVGDAWAWGKRGAEGDVTPLTAATFARYGYVTYQQEYGGDLFIY